MTSIPKATLISAVMLAAGALSGCSSLDPSSTIARWVGTQLGTRIGAALPVAAATSTSTDDICSVLRRLKAPVAVAGLPRNAATEFALSVDKYGVTAGCWRAPAPPAPLTT